MVIISHLERLRTQNQSEKRLKTTCALVQHIIARLSVIAHKELILTKIKNKKKTIYYNNIKVRSIYFYLRVCAALGDSVLPLSPFTTNDDD